MLTRIHTLFIIRLNDTKARAERGASAVEYSIIVAAIAAVIIAIVYLVGTKVLGNYNDTNASLSGH